MTLTISKFFPYILNFAVMLSVSSHICTDQNLGLYLWVLCLYLLDYLSSNPFTWLFNVTVSLHHFIIILKNFCHIDTRYSIMTGLYVSVAHSKHPYECLIEPGTENAGGAMANTINWALTTWHSIRKQVLNNYMHKYQLPVTKDNCKGSLNSGASPHSDGRSWER